MSNASTRLLNIIKSTSESTNKVSSRIVTLEITSLSPLVFKYDKLIIDKDFYVRDKNFSTEDLVIGSKVKALMTNEGQTYYILANKSAGGGGGGTTDYDDLSNKPSINGTTLSGNKTTSDLGITIPTKVSQLTNDSGYITGYTETDPTVPNHVKNITQANINSWNNKSDFSGDYNDLTNKPTIPTKTSDLTNDSNYVTDASYVHTDNNFTSALKTKLNGIETGAQVNKIETIKVNGTAQTITSKSVDISIPTKTSDLNNDSGFITNTVNNLTNYTLSTSTGSTIDLSINSSTYVVTLNLKNSAGTTISTGTIDLPLESVVVDGEYDDTTKKIILTLQNGNTIEFSVADLVSGLQTEITSTNKLSSDLVDDTNHTNKFVTASDITNWNAKGTYSKPSGGIPKTDLDSSVQTSLGLADTAIQDISGKQDVIGQTLTADWVLSDGTAPTIQDGYYFTGSHHIIINNETKSDFDNSLVYFKTVDYGDNFIEYYIYCLTLTNNGNVYTASYDTDSNVWGAGGSAPFLKGNIDTSIPASPKDFRVPSTKLLKTQLDTKQGTLTAGTGITISNNVISATGGGGTSDYTDLTNKPSINSVTLSGNKTSSDLNLLGISDLGNIPHLDISDFEGINNVEQYKGHIVYIETLTSLDLTPHQINELFWIPTDASMVPRFELQGIEIRESSDGKPCKSLLYCEGRAHLWTISSTSLMAGTTTVTSSSTDNEYPTAKSVYDAIQAGGGGTSDYTDLTNKPSINNVTLTGNKTSADLGLPIITYGTTDLNAGVSELSAGELYFWYE